MSAGDHGQAVYNDTDHDNALAAMPDNPDALRRYAAGLAGEDAS